MNIVQLKQLLAKSENPKLEFKAQWYSSFSKLDDKGWGEFLKDVISLANGNVGYVGNPGYLIIGADDEDPLPTGIRKTFHTPSIGELSQLQKLREITLRKLQSACSPPIPDITFEFLAIDEGKELLVIEVASPAGLVKLARDLSTRGMHFRKGTVLNRVGQDVCVADPTEIVALEREFASKFKNSTPFDALKVFHNLPQPDYVRFIGRKDELNRLRELLHPKDRIWTIVIDGIGGIGKSALALEIAHRYLVELFGSSEESFKAIIWISAKTDTLTADGIKSRQQVSRTLNDIFKTIAVTLEEDEILKARIEDQDRLINRALSRQRTLLIVDNLETIDDEKVNAFIRELPAPTKCIVTTRHRIDVADPIRLTGMHRDDALSLIVQECNKKNVQLSDGQIDLLYRRTGGVPLAIVWSIAQMGYGHDVQTVLHTLGNARGDIARYCFENAINRLRNSPAYVLLLCISLCVYSSSSTRERLGEISDLSELDRDEGLVELEKLSLINRQKNNFSILPLVRQYVIESIADIPSHILEKIALAISRTYAPEGAEALSLIQNYIKPEALVTLKEEITRIVINQMYDWLTNYSDDYGASMCVAPLVKLGTPAAITELKAIAGGSLILGWGSSNLEYAEQEALTALGRAGELEYLLDWLAKKMPYCSYLKYDDVINVIKQFGNAKIGSKIDQLLLEVSDIDIVEALQKIKLVVSVKS